MVRESRSSLVTNGETSSTSSRAINEAMRANPMIELIDLRPGSKDNLGSSRNSREKLPPRVATKSVASSREHVVSSKKKTLSSMSD